MKSILITGFKFEELINLPARKRPLRNSVALDMGAQRMNEVTEPVRQAMLNAFRMAEFDGAIT